MNRSTVLLLDEILLVVREKMNGCLILVLLACYNAPLKFSTVLS